MPRVSITIPTFNSARFLGRAIDTALYQTYTDYEVIVVDDGSTDGTRDLVTQFGDKIRYVYQDNRGLSSARNLALSHARGEFIAYLDADDMWYPGKLEKQVEFLDAHKECGFVHSEFALIDEADSVIHRRFNLETQRETPEGYCTLSLLRQCHIRIPTVLERRACFERVGRFDGRLKACQDYLHWIRVAMEGMAIGYIAEPLVMYRRTANSLSSSSRRMAEDYLMIFETLSRESSLAPKHGQMAMDVVRGRVYSARRELAYLDRQEGSIRNSLGHISSLIPQWPLRWELYLDLVKTCVRWALGSGRRM